MIGNLWQEYRRYCLNGPEVEKVSEVGNLVHRNLLARNVCRRFRRIILNSLARYATLST